MRVLFWCLLAGCAGGTTTAAPEATPAFGAGEQKIGSSEQFEFFRSTLAARHPEDLPLCGSPARSPDSAIIFRQLAMEDAPLAQRARAIDALKCMDDPESAAFLLDTARDLSLPPLLRAAAIEAATQDTAIGEWRSLLLSAVSDEDPRVALAAAKWVVALRDSEFLEQVRSQQLNSRVHEVLGVAK